MSATDLVIDPEFAALCQPGNKFENHLLEQSIREEGCRDPLIVWKERNILIDGHRRYAVCQVYKQEFSLRYVPFGNRESAIEYAIGIQLQRRNVQRRVFLALLGKRYNLLVARGADVRFEPGGVAGKMDRDHGAARRTAQRAGKFAKGLDVLAEAAGKKAVDGVLSGELDVTDERVAGLADLPKELQERAARMIAEEADVELDEMLESLEANGEMEDEEPMEALRDPLGTAIPHHLREIAANSYWTERIETVERVAKELWKARDKTVARYLLADKAKNKAHELTNLMLNAMFFCVCPKCNGDELGCGDCRSTGYVPKWRLDELDGVK